MKPEHIPTADKMQDRRPVYLLALIVLFLLCVHIFLVRRVSFCGVPDACSYYDLARSLDTGRGFFANFLMDLQMSHLHMPLTGIEYWRPGTSFFLLLAHPFGGVTLHSSLIVTILASIVVGLAAWHTAMHLFADRTIALWSTALCLVMPPVFSSTSPDSTLFYAAAISWFLALFTVRFQGYAADICALLCIGIAYTIRNDGILLLLPMMVVLYLRHRSPRQPGSSAIYCALMILGSVAALVPMHWIDHVVLGTAFPDSTARALYFTSLGDMSSYGLVDRHTWMHAGVGALVKARIAAFATILYRNVFLEIGFGAIFLILPINRRIRASSAGRVSDLASPAAFMLGMLFVYSALLPAIGTMSGLRTFVGLLPFIAVGIVFGVRSITPAFWKPVTAAVIGYYFIFSFMDSSRQLVSLAENEKRDLDYASFLQQHGAAPDTSLLLIADPVQFSVTTGYASIELPNNGVQAISQAARDLHATHVFLDLSSADEPLSQVATDLNARDVAVMPLTTNALFTLSPSGPSTGK